MRISTSMMYDLSSAGMSDQQSALYKTQQQMSTQRRMLSAADDPAGASTALRLSQGLALTGQQQASQQAATSTLSQSESALGSVGDVLQSASSLLISTQNATFSASDRAAAATQLDAMLQTLTGLANSRDGAGGYLFAGYSDGTLPFTEGAGGVSYAGDDGVRKLDIGAGRNVPVSANGADTFMRIKTGNGVFATSAGTANTGTGVIDSGSVVNPSALDGHAYQVKFTASGTYDLLDTTAGTTVSTGNTFKTGSAVTVAGMQFTINGNPAAGDTFTTQPSTNQSVFAALSAGIAALKSNAPDSVRTSQINGVLANVYAAQDHISQARSALGSNMNQVSSLGDVASAAVVSQKTQLSNLTDLDYASAATDLASEQTALTAAQQTFAKISKLSLFNYLA
ncbi:MAG: flagellar hook-associated protein 3 [Betaproteobacteria bacterium]|nr:flagellar hook-associated protein 3 [Betaproteobacteria bacterium]